jgi:hypothetical protein
MIPRGEMPPPFSEVGDVGMQFKLGFFCWRRFRSRCVYVTHDWLEGCLSHFLSLEFLVAKVIVVLHSGGLSRGK